MVRLVEPVQGCRPTGRGSWRDGACAARCTFKRSSPPRQWSARPSGRRRRLRSPISPPLGLDESYPALWRCKGVSLEASQNQR
ncbi:hypothetical protein KL910_002801 [Ogataea haglerorum]|nr:hypothetical protein KL910_002801 [Ogataea haglerorum]